MMDMSLEHQHGNDLMRKIEGKEPMTLPLSDSRVQVFLAVLAFPGQSNAIGMWAEGTGGDEPLSSRFRAYIEDPESKTPGSIDVHNQAALAELLSEVKKHIPETLH